MKIDKSLFYLVHSVQHRYVVLYKWRVSIVTESDYLRRSTTNSRKDRFKKTVLEIAVERHLLEVAFYNKNGNAVRMWGKKEVDTQLAEYQHYLAAA